MLRSAGHAGSFTRVPNTVMLLGALAFVGFLLVAAVLLGINSRPGRHARIRPHRDSFRQATVEPPRKKRAAVIINPTKFDDLATVRATLAAVATGLDWDAPLIVETTKEDPGAGQASAAVAEGVDLVCSLGGDGTVRNVASALAGTSTPLGLLPGGTGNLLARNLELPVSDLAEAFRVACTGRNRAIDVAYAVLAQPDSFAPANASKADASTSDSSTSESPSVEHAFLVMAGVGLDATIMSETTEEAKAKIDWPAYAATGFRNFLGPRLKAHVSIDGGPATSVLAQTVLVGNCGRITGGINLMPDAEPDDGVLDCVILAPKGFPGWVNVTARVLTQHRGTRTERLQRHTATTVTITTDKPQAVQLDGDVIGETREIRVRIAPRSLLVRST